MGGLLQEDCNTLKKKQAWKDFADVVPYYGMGTVTASVSDGGRFQAADGFEVTNGSKSYELEKSYSYTFYAYAADNYQVDHVYVNGTDVIDQMTTESDGRLKYTMELMQDNVTIDVVGIPYTKQTLISVGSTLTTSFDSYHNNKTMTTSIPANNVATMQLPGYVSGDQITLTIQKQAGEAVQVLRNGLDVTDYFTKTATALTFTATGPEATALWNDKGVNVWDEATWVVKSLEISETANVIVSIEASAPAPQYVNHSWWLNPGKTESDKLYPGQTRTYTVPTKSTFSMEMDNETDDIYGVDWRLKTLYVNGIDVTDDIENDMTSWYNIENILSDTYVRAVLEPNCYFVRVMSMGPDLLWTSADDNEHLIDCAEGDNYYVPVPKRGNKGVEVRTDFIENFNQSPATLGVTMWKNNGMYTLGTATYAEGGIEVTDDGKNYHFLLLPGVEEQDRIINTWKKDKPVWTISKSDDCPNVELQSSSSSSLITGNFLRISEEIDPSSYYGLLVYKGNEGRTVRVIKNGVDVSNQFTEQSTDDYFKYNLDPTADEAWEISYVPVLEMPTTIDLSFVGEFDFVGYKSDEEATSPRPGEYFYLDDVDGYVHQQITEGKDLNGILAQLKFKPKDSKATIKVYCNGYDLTESLQKTELQPGVLNYYYLAGSGESWHSPASWVIVAGSYDVNGDGDVNVTDVTTLVNKILNP